MPDTNDQSFDIGIVGGGPAGLSAAIWSARYGHTVALIDSGDPRNWETRGVNGYLGLPGVTPAALRGNGRNELKSYGVTLIDAAALRIDREGAESHSDGGDAVFTINIEQGRVVCARRILLAIGMRDAWPDIPGLSHVYGANAHVCPDCDGYEARNKRVVVIGHGRRVVSMALALTTWTRRITIVTNGSGADLDEELRAKLDHVGISVRTEQVSNLAHVGKEITCLRLANGDELEIDKLFFTIAQFPADDLGVQLGCERDTGGHIVVNEKFKTTVNHVFAAGDITPGPQLAVRAASAGAVAAMAMHQSLIPPTRTLG
jgi:thioredoxin reductase